MSAPRVIAELVVTGIRVLGKATAAAGAQAVKNFKHKPEAVQASASSGGAGSSKSQITNQMQMSLDEAHLILNVKKDDPMEIIQKNYERIFASNSPPPEPTPASSSSTSSASTAPTTASRRTPTASAKAKGPTHSHYLQSKVYRALERIKAEREAESGSGPGGPANVVKPGEELSGGLGQGGAAGVAGAAEGTATGAAPAGGAGPTVGST